MVVHPAPGNHDGTLVNALLYHFEQLAPKVDEPDHGNEDEVDRDALDFQQGGVPLHRGAVQEGQLQEAVGGGRPRHDRCKNVGRLFSILEPQKKVRERHDGARGGAHAPGDGQDAHVGMVTLSMIRAILKVSSKMDP